MRELLMDCLRIGPAPTRSREAFVALFALVVVGVLLVVMQPEVMVTAVVIAGSVSYLTIRWIVGTRRWGRR